MGKSKKILAGCQKIQQCEAHVKKKSKHNNSGTILKVCLILCKYKRMANDKRTVYVGGLAEECNEKLINDAFVPFGDLVEIQIPVDFESQKHSKSF